MVTCSRLGHPKGLLILIVTKPCPVQRVEGLGGDLGLGHNPRHHFRRCRAGVSPKHQAVTDRVKDSRTDEVDSSNLTQR